MANYIDNFNSLDWQMPFARTGKFPIDKSSIFGSLADAQKYAKGDSSDLDERELALTSYVGQIITVYENSKVDVYKINEDRTLEKLGTATSEAETTRLVEELQEKVNTIQGEGEGSIKKAVADEAKIAREAEQANKTEISNEVSAREQAITALKGTATADYDTLGEAEAKIKEAKSAADNAQQTANSKISAVNGNNTVKAETDEGKNVSLSLVTSDKGNVKFTQDGVGLSANITIEESDKNGEIKVAGSAVKVHGLQDLAYVQKATLVSELDGKYDAKDAASTVKTELVNGASEGYQTLKGLEDKIKAEASRADATEKVNAKAIKDLTEGAVAQNTEKIGENTQAIADEASTARAAEQANASAIKEEVKTARAAELENKNAIADVKKTADSALQSVLVDNSSIEGNGKDSAIKIKASGVTNDMLAGSIADAKIDGVSASKVTLVDTAEHTTETSVEGAIAELYTKEEATATALGTKGAANENTAFGLIAKNAKEIATLKDVTVGGTHFIGVTTGDLSTTNIVTDVYPDGRKPVVGDFVIKGQKEYIFSAGAWVELGDTTEEGKKITALEDKTADVTTTVGALIDSKVAGLNLGNTYAGKAYEAKVDALEGKVDVEKVSTAISTAKTEANQYADGLNTAMGTRVDKVASDLAAETQARKDEITRVEGLATEAKNTADAKVASVSKVDTTAIEIKGTPTAPQVGLKLGNQALNIVKLAQTNDGLVANLSIATGTANGTIAVNDEDVAVKGLGSAAYTEAGAYDAKGTGATEAKAVKEALLGNAPSGTTLETLNTAIEGEVSTRTELSNKVNGIEAKVDVAKVSTAISDALTPYETAETAAGKYVAKKGYVEYTQLEKTKLGGIAEGANVNNIEKIKFNGVVIEPTGSTKEVAINVDASKLTLGTEVSTHQSTDVVSTVLTDIYNQLSGKVVSVASADNDATVSVTESEKAVKLSVGISTDTGNLLKKGTDHRLFAAMYYDGDDAEA